MSVVAMALALRNLERRLSRGQDVGQYSRDLLTNAAKELERLDSALLSAMTSRERSAADLGAERARLKVTVEAHLERTTALAKAVADMESRYRTALGCYNNLVVRYDELQAHAESLAANQCDGPKVGDEGGNFSCALVARLTEAGEKLAEDRQVQVDALLARVADLESQLVERKTRHDVETEQLRSLSARLEEIEPKVDELAARYGRLLVAFHDATRTPLGVTPDSGTEFFDYKLAYEAEARYTRHGRGRL